VARRAPAAVSVESVDKTFLIPHERYTSFQSRAVELFRPQRYSTLQTLDGVSFDVEQGEFFGVVGPNGSGKSTLLKCIAGIYASDSGSVTVTGRLSPFLEMGVGFKDELTARENVVLNGTLLGLSPAQIRQGMDDIIAFADLEEFADLNLKNFSSGMRVRLAFSLAIQVDADILLLDEVLAVGDEAFRQKCFEEFRLFKEEGRTVLLVTHSMDTINRFCDRALLLDAGRVARVGEPAWVAEGYTELNARLAKEREAAQARSDPDRIPRLPDRRRKAFASIGRPTTYKPSAFGDDWRRFARVTLTLAKTEFKLNYRGSVLGYVWSLMQPLMLFGVLYAVFSGIVGVGAVKMFPLYVLSAVVLWTYFSEATSGGVGSLVRGEGLLRKMRFPPLAIPLSISLKALFNLGTNALVVVGFALATGVRPRLSWLELPLLVLLLVALTTGVTLLLSSLYVRYRDTEQIWRVVERVLFFGSPIFYAATQYPDAIRELVAMTPLVMVFSEMRHAFIDASAPSAAALAGGTPWLLVPIALSVGVLGLGLLTFDRHAARIAERL
jgi:ABC-type polysaccharide/polyol phosphate transport system ATPase subunit/ABC-type polysaccharide/polyol phosphate export permease